MIKLRSAWCGIDAMRVRLVCGHDRDVN